MIVYENIADAAVAAIGGGTPVSGPTPPASFMPGAPGLVVWLGRLGWMATGWLMSVLGWGEDSIVSQLSSMSQWVLSLIGLLIVWKVARLLRLVPSAGKVWRDLKRFATA